MTCDSTLGVIENVPLDFGVGPMYFQVQVTTRTNFDVLLGRPFFKLTSCRTFNLPNGKQDILLTDPNARKELRIPTLPWVKHVLPKELKRAGRRFQRGGFLIVDDLQYSRGGTHLHSLFHPPSLMHSNSYFPISPTQCSFSRLAPNTCVEGTSQYMLQAPTLQSLAIPDVQYSARYAHLTSMHSVLDKGSINAFNSIYAFDPACHALVYKPVAKKVRTVPTTMPAEYRVVRQLPADPLAGLPPLPSRPPEFCPGAHFMRECADKLDLDPAKWLWPEELKLVQWLVRAHERAFAWNASERGRLNETCFPPYKIPTIPHMPWSQHNIPIPPATLGEVVHIIKEKIVSGVYKPSMAAY